jgi:long-chain acyl-CoA synthetase
MGTRTEEEPMTGTGPDLSTIARGFVDALPQRREQVTVRWRDDGGEWRSWTTGELAELIARVAAGLRALGLRPGQRVLLMMRNIAEFHVADLAVMFAGGTPVSIYNSSAPEQVAYLAGHAEATIAILEDPEFLARFDAVREQLPELARFVVIRDAPAERDDVTPWSELVAQEPLDLGEATEGIGPDDAATVIYTSGTTGNPKGVVITHRNVCSQVRAVQTLLGGEQDGVRVVSYLPMAHIAERAVSHYGLALNGLEVSCCPDVNQLGEYLAAVRPQVVFGVPRVWEKIRARVIAALAADPARAAAFDQAIELAKPIALARNWDTATDEQNAMWERLQEGGLRQVRELIGLDQAEYAISGAAPIPVEVIEWFNALGVPLSEVYGMSENTGGMTWIPRRIKPGTVGKPYPGAEVRIAEDGEVLCRGELVFPGYLKDPQMSAEAIDSDGWLHTGDIGELDEDGYLKIVDRKKELIITAGGKNVSPPNLEAALKTIPLVGQAFAVGDAKPYTAALVVLDPEVAPGWATANGIASSSLVDLARHPAVVEEIERGVEAAMAPFSQTEKIKRVRVLGVEWLSDSDELTPTAKLKRRVIRTKYADEIESLYT